jgi:hypothetical protein
MSTKLSSFALEYAPWSISKLSVAAQCPLKFYLNYVVKKKIEKRDSTALIVGKAVHEILEHMLRNNDWQHAYNLATAKQNLTTAEIDLILGMKPDIFTFLDLLNTFRERHSIELIHIEKKMGMDSNLKSTGFFSKNVFFRGVIDLVLFPDHTSDIVVIDHKTGKVKSTESYATQLRCYTILAKVLYPSLTHAICGVHHLQASNESKVLFTSKSSIVDIQPHWEMLVEYINNATRNTHNFKQTKTGWWCNFCDYQIGCPAHDKGNNGDKNNEEAGNLTGAAT